MANFITRIFNRREAEKPKRHIELPPIPLQRIRQDAKKRKEAIEEMERGRFQHRVKIQKLYLNTAENGFVKACVDKRKDLTMLRKWTFTDSNGNQNDNVLSIFCDNINGRVTNKKWFEDFLSHSLDAMYYGYSLIYIGDVENSEIKNTTLYKRILVSPDRFCIGNYEYSLGGTNFIENKEYAPYHAYIQTRNTTGTSPCGYGIFFEVSIYEILLRNLLGFNGDYVEVNIAPFRQVKTVKTEENEREELFQQALNMASNGVAVTDPSDEIIFHPTNSGTGYNAYDNFEKRLEAKIAQLILGHADAMSSIPGKLGNDNGESPAQKALEDKQSVDGTFITDVVNNLLIPKLRFMGFNIPDGIVAQMLNDNEENENANKVTDLAVKMKSAGLQMDDKYFTEKTGIPVAMAIPQPKPLPQQIMNKLKMMYNHRHG